ncbi:unnamed protein product, partial [Dracunculus medinensis]|uniref:Neur_chan_LBD domain-containing protein n=1 Tax=Dracunculus medinensis TaxID=318479 RepID=A0A0N4U125_DRAME
NELYGKFVVIKTANYKLPAKSLYENLFDGYQKELRPVNNYTKPTKVALKFWLKQILKVNARDQIVKVHCWLELYWNDEFLKWNPSLFNGIKQIHVPAGRIWEPDILVYNNANMNTANNELETNAVIKHNGNIILFKSLITDVTCNMNLIDFPFDQQVCYLTFSSWSMDSGDIELEATNNTDNLAMYISNAEWSLADFAIKTYRKYYECCTQPFIDVTYFMVIKRSPSYYLFSLVIPSAVITVVTMVGFFTPHSTSGENTEKVSLGVTALLSMAIIMMMVSDNVPTTSEVIPLIGKYYIGLIFLIFLAAITTTLTLTYQMRGNSGIPINRFIRSLYEKIACSSFLSWIFSVHFSKFNYDNDSITLEKVSFLSSKSFKRRKIRQEWQQATRIIDRLVMIFYVLITIIFVVYVLRKSHDDIYLNDQLMDGLKADI